MSILKMQVAELNLFVAVICYIINGHTSVSSGKDSLLSEIDDVGANYTVSRGGKGLNDQNECGVVMETKDGHTVTWNIDRWGGKFLATPQCLDTNYIYVLADCSNKEIDEKVECAYAQKNISICPDGFEEDNDGCSKLLGTATYKDSVCPYPYEQHPSESNELTWLQAKRNFDYGIGEFVYEGMPRSYEKSIVTRYINSSSINGYDCIVYNSSTSEVVSCNSKYQRFCSYDVVMNKENHFCRHVGKNYFGSSFDIDNFKCFFIRDVCDKFAVLKYPYQNKIFNRTVRIGLEFNDSDQSLRWTGSGEKLTYGYWSDTMYREINGITVVLLTRDGWETLYLNNETYVSLCEFDFDYKKPSLSLTKYDTMIMVNIQNPLSLARNNEGYFVFCFTDSIPNHLFDINKAFKMEEVIFQIQPINSGYYWCQAYDLLGWKKISTDKMLIVLDQVFPIEIVVSYIQNEDPTKSEIAYTKYISTTENNFVKNTEIKAKFKWMKTLEINETIREVTYLIHICTNSTDNVDHYNLLNNSLWAIKYIAWIKNISKLYHLQYCLTQTDIQGNITLTWNQTMVGTNVTSQENCLDENGKRITRSCIANFYDGARWSEPINCHVFDLEESKWTNILIDLLEENDPNEIVNGLEATTEYSYDYAPIDVHLTALLLKTISNETSLAADRIVQIVSNVMNCSSSTLRSSQLKLKATDKLLFYFDAIINNVKNSTGGKVIDTTNVIIYSFDATSDEYVGLALLESSNEHVVTKLRRNVTIKDLLVMPNLQAASFIPGYLLELIAKEVDKYVVLTVFLTDVLFNEAIEDQTVIARNIAILLPEFQQKTTMKIPIIFKPQKRVSWTDPRCGYWKYTNDLGSGMWSLESRPEHLSPTFLMCHYEHATHYGLLLSTTKSKYSTAYDIATVVGGSLSLVGFFGIFTTAAILRTWREHNKMLIHFSTVSCTQIILVFISFQPQENYSEPCCILLGVMMQYTVTAQFTWMLVFAICQYYRCLYPLRGPNVWVYNWAWLFTYIVSAVPVLILVSFFRNTYLNGGIGFCYPSGEALRFGVLVPIATIVGFNCLVFCVIVYHKFVKEPRSSTAIADNMFTERIGLVVMLFFLTGITWVFGLLVQLFPGFVLEFSFSLMASIQGFVLFLLFIVRNKAIRDSYARRWKRHRYAFWRYKD